MNFRDFVESARDFHNELMARHRVPPIDPEQYPERPGLEGPFRMRNGRVLYYDPKEGKYYDAQTDMYVGNDELTDIMA